MINHHAVITPGGFQRNVPGTHIGKHALRVTLQGVPEAKEVKNRMHLDIDVVDIEAEASRLEALGARRVESEPMHEHGTNWILMADPEGNEFCVCDGGQSQAE